MVSSFNTLLGHGNFRGVLWAWDFKILKFYLDRCKQQAETKDKHCAEPNDLKSPCPKTKYHTPYNFKTYVFKLKHLTKNRIALKVRVHFIHFSNLRRDVYSSPSSKGTFLTTNASKKKCNKRKYLSILLL